MCKTSEQTHLTITRMLIDGSLVNGTSEQTLLTATNFRVNRTREKIFTAPTDRSRRSRIGRRGILSQVNDWHWRVLRQVDGDHMMSSLYLNVTHRNLHGEHRVGGDDEDESHVVFVEEGDVQIMARGSESEDRSHRLRDG